MAPKRQSPIDDPPAAPSSDEHEEPSSEEEEEEEDPSEDVEEEEEQEAQKTPQKPSASASAGRSSKRTKKGGGDGGGGGDEKKLSQRLWSEDDEIAILEGMIAFSSEKGSDPSADMAAFHEFVRSSIRVEDFTKSQLGDKVRRLRKKFANNAAKSSYDPATPHERKAFELSERIWGFAADDNGPATVPNGTPSSALANGLASPERVGNPGVLAGVLRLQGSRLPESAVRQGLGLIPEDKKAELEAEWREIHLAELELLAQKTQLMSEQWRMIFDALKSDC